MTHNLTTYRTRGFSCESGQGRLSRCWPLPNFSSTGHGDAVKQVVDVPSVDDGSAESNLLEAGEHGSVALRERGGVSEAPEAEVEGAEGGKAEDVDEAIDSVATHRHTPS
jgi:hypothetical protein